MKNLVSVSQSKESKKHQVLLGAGKRKLSVFPARIEKYFQFKKKVYFPISQVSEGTLSTTRVILRHYNIWIWLHFFFSNIGGYCLIKLVSGRI